MKASVKVFKYYFQSYRPRVKSVLCGCPKLHRLYLIKRIVL